MCRLLGVITNKDVDIEFSFLKADEPFKKLGNRNPDGWGIGWYKNDGPEIFKEGLSTFESGEFAKKAKEVRSRIIISHVRTGTGAEKAERNSHPFSFDRFIFAHNGSVDRDSLMDLLEEDFKKAIKGETDSEVFFYWILQNIKTKSDVIEGIRSAVNRVTEFNHTGLNFLLSDGSSLYAFRYSSGSRGYYSLFYLKRDQADDRLLSLQSKETRMLLYTKSLNREKAVLVCSEKLTEEQWKEIPFGQLLIVSSDLSTRLEEIYG